MKIYINGRFLSQRRSGMQRWAEEVTCALDDRLARAGSRQTVELLVPRQHRDLALNHIRIREIGHLRGHGWEQWDLLGHARDGLLINLLSSGPVLHPRQIVTFHDAAIYRYPELFSRLYRNFHRPLRRFLARRAVALMTVSSFSATELAEVFSIPAERFVIVPNAADHMAGVAPDDGVLERLELAPERYGLCVGNQTPNKNLATAAEAFIMAANPGAKLVLVGAREAKVFGTIELAEHAEVVNAGYLSDGELCALYRHAAFLCFPSRYEGFGIPVIEAMTLGCPVVASTAGAVRETAGGAAIHVDPDDREGFASAMGQLLVEKALRDELRARGYDRARAYSWDRSAAVLEALLFRYVAQAEAAP